MQVNRRVERQLDAQYGRHAVNAVQTQVYHESRKLDEKGKHGGGEVDG